MAPRRSRDARRGRENGWCSARAGFRAARRRRARVTSAASSGRGPVVRAAWNTSWRKARFPCKLAAVEFGGIVGCRVHRRRRVAAPSVMTPTMGGSGSVPTTKGPSSMPSTWGRMAPSCHAGHAPLNPSRRRHRSSRATPCGSWLVSRSRSSLHKGWEGFWALPRRDDAGIVWTIPRRSNAGRGQKTPRILGELRERDTREPLHRLLPATKRDPSPIDGGAKPSAYRSDTRSGFAPCARGGSHFSLGTYLCRGSLGKVCTGSSRRRSAIHPRATAARRPRRIVQIRGRASRLALGAARTSRSEPTCAELP